MTSRYLFPRVALKNRACKYVLERYLGQLHTDLRSKPTSQWPKDNFTLAYQWSRPNSIELMVKANFTLTYGQIQLHWPMGKTNFTLAYGQGQLHAGYGQIYVGLWAGPTSRWPIVKANFTLTYG